MELICLSDTHGLHRELTVPEGDVLIHAGDFTSTGGVEEAVDFCRWMQGLPHPHKIVVAGNHDIFCQDSPRKAVDWMFSRHGIHYLQDSGITLNGMKFWGSPWQPWFHDWAFNFSRDPVKGKSQALETWEKIPTALDVLITHGPPYGVLDVGPSGSSVGCPYLLDAVRLKKPKVHVFGHIHEGYGHESRGGTDFLNASMVYRGRLGEERDPWSILFDPEDQEEGHGPHQLP